MTIESAKEQSKAGLDEMTFDEKLQMKSLNSRYKEKFGFPFVICARLNRKNAILKGLEERYNNDLKKELEIGIGEVMKICELRVKDIVSPNPIQRMSKPKKSNFKWLYFSS